MWARSRELIGPNQRSRRALKALRDSTQATKLSAPEYKITDVTRRRNQITAIIPRALFHDHKVTFFLSSSFFFFKESATDNAGVNGRIISCFDPITKGAESDESGAKRAPG